MSRIVAVVRFVLGLGMVAAGATLAAPTGIALVREAMRHHTQPVVAPAPTAPFVDAGPHAGAPPQPQSQAAAVSAWPASWPMPEDMPPSAADQPINPHYQPPPPPVPLPPPAGELVAAPPEVATAYRPTLDVPPPPLLDAHAPPPLAVGWAAHDVDAARVQQMPAAVVPQTYVVRDGDDLTGIATRFYGHAAAATAIWHANHDLLADPNVLPIGAAIRMPPAWSVRAVRDGDAGAIGPRSAAPRPVDPGSPAVAQPAGWLGGGAGAVATNRPAAPVRPQSVRVGPGETLTTLARRFYGDERMAERIWDANRDRLRSPALIVPGMELRLP